MAYRIRRVDYYYATLLDEPGEGYKLLTRLAELGINLLAFTGVPIGPSRTQLTVFPGDSRKLESAAKNAGLALDGPHPALLVQGDDELRFQWRDGRCGKFWLRLVRETRGLRAGRAVTGGVTPDPSKPVSGTLDLSN